MSAKMLYCLALLPLVGKLTFAMEQSTSTKNIAVFGGGGVNAYASLVMASKFAEFVGRPFNEIFHEGWAISGGTIPATLLMSGKYKNEEAVRLFKSTVGNAFPNFEEFIFDALDSDGIRRDRFENELKPHFSDFCFGRGKNNKFVYIASANGEPVFYCDPDMAIGSELRCKEGTSCIDGIIGSSSWTFNFFGNKALFQTRIATLDPDNLGRTICDGGLCNKTRDDDRFVVDGYTPTPLVIEYLKNTPGNHNIVVFDNGGPSNAAFRNLIRFDRNGVGLIEGDKVTIKVFILAMTVEGFDRKASEKSFEHLSYLEAQVDQAISGQSATVLKMAMRAVR